MVSVELLPAVTEVGFSVADAPEGAPLTTSETVPALPLVTAVPMVEVPLLPCCRLSDVGLALMEKSLVAVPPQPGNLNEPIRVLQLNAPVVFRYSVVYQKVQSSVGSTPSIE